jgi:hypothetical protein
MLTKCMPITIVQRSAVRTNNKKCEKYFFTKEELLKVKNPDQSMLINKYYIHFVTSPFQRRRHVDVAFKLFHFAANTTSAYEGGKAGSILPVFAAGWISWYVSPTLL